MKNKLLIVFLLSILFRCKHHITCIGIQDGQYNGYGLVFYHKLDTGSSYELLIIPTCNDRVDLKMKLTNEGRLTKLKGVMVFMNSRNPAMSELLNNSVKSKILNRDSLAPQLQSIFISSVYVKFKEVRNDTRTLTKLDTDYLFETYELENNIQLTIEYFISSEITIDSVRVLK